MTQPNCQNCAFYVHKGKEFQPGAKYPTNNKVHGTDYGECRGALPVAIPQVPPGSGRWPLVWANEWCQEFTHPAQVPQKPATDPTILPFDPTMSGETLAPVVNDPFGS